MGDPQVVNEEAAARREEAARLREIDAILQDLARRSPEPAEQERLQQRLKALSAELEALRRARVAGRGVAGPSRGELLGESTTGITAEATLRMAYVPTGVVHLLGAPSAFEAERPLITVTVRWGGGPTGNPAYGPVGGGGVKRLRVEAVVEGYSAREIHTREVEASAKEAVFHLMPAFLADRVATVSETRRAALQLKVSQLANAGASGELVELERTYHVWLLARQAACVFMADPATGEMRDYSYALGAWVTPNEPSVLELLSNAAGQLAGGFFGRQDRTDAAIEAQVQLLYETLSGSGWRYVDFITTTPDIEGSFFQRVRLPGEVLRLRAANCLDGALLFASLLEAASLAPALVLMKDHAIVAWRRVTPDEGGEWAYLDTTYLGRGPFSQARAEGQQLAAVRAMMAKISGMSEHFRRWPLAELRERGITPLE